MNEVKVEGAAHMSKVKTFLGEVKHELKETTWPTKEAMRKNTLTVFGVMAFFGVFFYAVDSVITFLLNLV
ncbi:SecE/Sec61-gamma subunits of protein translocation complex [Alkalibacterium putridalgicola]|jgi:preprotein translocase subunit SecE|uniref:Protein translocase subunit SecE n=2 Tax=Alkalibacterium putridalgicola TaxID=426703 RepID=A0A1H7WBK9_9LACT|nr:SecE/Sec61-gamma subunits of protein translocation complex [Alkalibacterium putridalgicola]